MNHIQLAESIICVWVQPGGECAEIAYSMKVRVYYKQKFLLQTELTSAWCTSVSTSHTGLWLVTISPRQQPVILSDLFVLIDPSQLANLASSYVLFVKWIFCWIIASAVKTSRWAIFYVGQKWTLYHYVWISTKLKGYSVILPTLFFSSHFILKWFQANSINETCFLEISYK